MQIFKKFLSGYTPAQKVLRVGCNLGDKKIYQIFALDSYWQRVEDRARMS